MGVKEGVVAGGQVDVDITWKIRRFGREKTLKTVKNKGKTKISIFVVYSEFQGRKNISEFPGEKVRGPSKGSQRTFWKPIQKTDTEGARNLLKVIFLLWPLHFIFFKRFGAILR